MSLSDNIFEVYESELNKGQIMKDHGYKDYPDVIKVKDVKEFIKLLKDEIIDKCVWMDVEPIIDKLAGSKLLEGGSEDE